MKQKLCKTKECDKNSTTKGLCKNHYWSFLYHSNRLSSKNGRGKLRPKPITYYDSNMNIRANPLFEQLYNGTGQLNTN